ncbi:MAG: response regulator [Coleofasciculaceae cyanobacterium SM2_1_6]|nr:response regulator [Coleofasciculaceae cyanobacterium SM2_1_6]
MDELISELETCVEEKFTGKLDISTLKGEYNVYFGLGRLIWAEGGEHPRRRWQRNLLKHCPHIDINQIKIRQTDEMDSWEYSTLVILLQREYITAEQLLAIVTASIIEILFDLIQVTTAAARSIHQTLTPRDEHILDGYRYKRGIALKNYSGIRPAGNHIMPRTLTLPLVKVISEVRQEWDSWLRVSSPGFSPNQLPVIKKPDVLEKKIVAKAYKNLLILTNGNYTIRDIAEILQKKPWEVMSLFIPHVRSGEIELVGVADWDHVPLPKEIGNGDQQDASNLNRTEARGDRRIDSKIGTNIGSGLGNNLGANLGTFSPSSEIITDPNPADPAGNFTGGEFLLARAASTMPLVAYIDDSASQCEAMNVTLQRLGYGVMVITNEVEALPRLIERIPDIIFLDLLMPVINGYELCVYIRRIASLEKTPVIILSEKNGIVDRTRAMLAGATDFLTKPIPPEKLLEALQKYILIAER